MPLTYYSGSATATGTGKSTAGNTVVIVTPTQLADVNVPKLTELNTGTSIEGSIEGYGISADAKMTTRQKLSDKVASEKPGQRTYSADDLVITIADPQATTDSLLAMFAQDAKLGLIMRPAKARGTAPAVGDKVQATNVTVATCALSKISTADGEEYSVVLKVAVDATSNPVLVAMVA